MAQNKYHGRWQMENDGWMKSDWVDTYHYRTFGIYPGRATALALEPGHRVSEVPSV